MKRYETTAAYTVLGRISSLREPGGNLLDCCLTVLQSRHALGRISQINEAHTARFDQQVNPPQTTNLSSG